MKRTYFTIIAYDIVKNNRRKKVSDFLADHGMRANKSVFELMVTQKQLKAILKQIRKWINPKTDTILVYRVCESCYVKGQVIGNSPELPPGLLTV